MIATYERTAKADQQRMYEANSRMEQAKAQQNQHKSNEREAEAQLVRLSSTYDLHSAMSRPDTTQRVGAALELIKGALQQNSEELSKAKVAQQQRLGALLSRKEAAKVKVDGTGAEIDKK